MKFSINQSELQNAISVVYKGISTRSTLPILSGILLSAQGDVLMLHATDLELSVQYKVNTLIEEEGQVVVPGKLFLEIVKSLPDAAVSLELFEQQLTVVCDNSSFSIKTLNAQDFPAFPTVEAQQTIKIPFAIFSSMVKKVARVVSKDESRPILTGILLTREENHLKMVATDSYRLAIVDTDTEQYQDEMFEAVISGSFLQDIASLPKTEDDVSLALSENQIVVQYQNTIFVNRRLEGTFPNYQQLLPEAYTTRVSLNNAEFISVVKRISLIDTKTTPIKFDINIDSQTLQISSAAQDIGSAQGILPCEIIGENNQIAFNYAYILDGLSSVEESKLFLEIQNSTKPGIFKTETAEKFLYLIMPVRI
ncbi:MAG: DNA polymerase III subunit beta [Eggerthellaceae bacterium]|nr:DNA polymerase III subunit beta [Eggerthellaceae bacterium]